MNVIGTQCVIGVMVLQHTNFMCTNPRCRSITVATVKDIANTNERKPALVDPHIMNPVEPTDFSAEAMTPIATANDIQHGGDHYKSKAI
jgi:hypothetical protein